MITNTQDIKAGTVLYWETWEQNVTVVKIINEWAPSVCNIKIKAQDGRNFWVRPSNVSMTA